MAIGRKWAILAVAIGFASGAAPAQAQSRTIDAELTSEMWALAGVCSQYANYTVRNEALATWLNTQLAEAGNGEDVISRKNAKVAEISANVAAMQTISSAGARTERSDQMTEGLMTRCRRLTNNPVAKRFFLTATG